jgi:hypothetical protein
MMKEKRLTKRKEQEKSIPKNEAKREHRITFLLNRMEYDAIERHLRKYKITNKSHWYRSTILTHVWKVLEEDYPTLFNENEMRR